MFTALNATMIGGKIHIHLDFSGAFSSVGGLLDHAFEKYNIYRYIDVCVFSISDFSIRSRALALHMAIAEYVFDEPKDMS